MNQHLTLIFQHCISSCNAATLLCVVYKDSERASQSCHTQVRPHGMSLILPYDYLMCFSYSSTQMPNPDMVGIAVAVASESGPTAATYSLHPNQCLGR